MKRRWLPLLAPLAGGAIFAAALYAIHRSLDGLSLSDVRRRLGEIPAPRLALALLLTLTSYTLLACNDWLALRWLRRPSRWPAVLLTGFVGYALNNNLGALSLTGGSVRYRVYTRWGLTAVEVLRVVVFCGLSLAIGAAVLAGLVLLFDPGSVFAPAVSRIVSAGALAIAAAYLGLARRGAGFTLRGVALTLPPLKFAAAQTALGALDLAASGLALYFLLPASANIGPVEFLAVYIAAAAAGIASQSPGGIGVFESIVVLALSQRLTPDAIVGALLAYRAIYYIFPLGAALIVIVIHGLFEHGRRLRPFARAAGKAAASLAPTALAAFTFVAGATLLFSGAVPEQADRLHLVADILPLYLLEASHFLGSIAGLFLLLLARGLQRRYDAAYHATGALLTAGAVLSLLKGFDYEEAALLCLLLSMLVLSRKRFNRKAALFAGRWTPRWVAAIGAVLGAAAWLGFLAHRNVPFREELWWQFTLDGSAPRYLRAISGTLVVAAGFAVSRLLRPARPAPAPLRAEDREHVLEIVRAAPSAHAWLALLGDKSILWNEDRTAFVMYGAEGRTCVSMGDPVGPPEQAAELAWAFRELCDTHGMRPVFYQVDPVNLPLYLDIGLTPLKIGEEAIVPLAGFSMEGGGRKNMRSTLNRMHKLGIAYEVVPAGAGPELLRELRAVSDGWLADKQAREKRFSLGAFREEYIAACPVAVARMDGRVVAFSNLWIGGARAELSVDLMRHAADAPNGIMDYLFIETMLWGAAAGFVQFNLGMAPLSGLADRSLAPLWNRIGASVFRHGEHFYNFQGLRRFKEKYDPRWRPRYIVSPAGFALPAVLLDAAALIAGGRQGILRK